MLFLLDANVRTVKWNGIPLHEASSAIVKEEINGDFVLTVRYPITDSGIYQLIKEDMLIKAPTPVLGPQLFRIKKPIENDDSLDITAYHISDDVMQRSVKPVSVVGQSCAMALSQMVQNTKSGIGDFSFTSDIMDSRTFNTTEAETLYSVLLDGKHSIVGTWEGELVRDNFALSIKRSRGADRGVIITTHKNLKSYQRIKNSQNVVTRIHARSTFKPEGAEDEVTLRVTVDSPLINSYPYINEKEYENNNAKTIDDLRKWAEAKFKNDGIDKVSDAIKIEAYELDGQVVHLGDTVNLKSRKHNADVYKKAIAYEFNALTEEYISLTFDDKPGIGGSGVSSGLSNAADAILGASNTAQEIAVQKAIDNANRAFDAEFDKRENAIRDGIEQAKAAAEVYADNIRQEITGRLSEVDKQVAANKAQQATQYAEILAKANANTNLAQEAKNLGNQAKTEAANALSKALQYRNEAIAEAKRLDSVERQATASKLATAKTQAIAEANKLVEASKTLLSTQIAGANQAIADAKKTLETQVSSVSLEVTKTNDTIKTLASKTDVDKTNQRVTSAETTLTQQANLLASKANQSTVDTLAGRMTTAEISITQQAGQIALKANKTDVDGISRRLTSAESSITQQAAEIAQRVKTTDFNQVTGRLTTAESSITQLGNRITTEISETVAKIPTEIGGRNLLAQKWFKRGFSSRDFTLKSWSEYLLPIGAIRNILEEGKTYTISYDWEIVAKTTVSKIYDIILGFYIYSATQSNGRLNLRVKSKNTLGDKGRFELTFVCPPLFDDSNILAYTNRYADGSNIDYDTVRFTNFNLVESRIAYKQWLQPIEDNEEEISRLQTTINTTSDGITQLTTKVNDSSNKISQAETKINQLIGEVSSKVSQTDFNKVKGRLNTAESSITQHADEISKRLTSTQVDNAITSKGYQTKAQVDSNITGRGYITESGVNGKLTNYVTATVMNQTVKETSDSFERSITATKALIPTDIGGENLLPTSSIVSSLQVTSTKKFTLSGWASTFLENEVIKSIFTAGETYTLHYEAKLTKKTMIPTLFQEMIGFLLYCPSDRRKNVSFTTKIQSIVGATTKFKTSFTMPEIMPDHRMLFYTNRYTTNGNSPIGYDEIEFFNFKIEKGNLKSDWSPAIEDLATLTALHEVRDTVDSHTRTISDQGNSISQVIQTASGLVTRVGSLETNSATKSALSATETRVSTLAGAWSVQNLTSSGDILSQANLSSAQFLLEAAKIRLKGKTLADEIQAIDGKFNTLFVADGTFAKLNANIIGAKAITGGQIKFDQAFFNYLTANEAYLKQLFAKNAFITQVQSVTMSANQISGGLLRALNNAMEINMNAGQLLYYTDQAALKRILSGYPTQFVKFATGNVDGKGKAGVTIIGSNRNGTENPDDGGFVGIRAWNGANIDLIDVVGDTVRLASSAYISSDGWDINTLPGKLNIDAHIASDRPGSRLNIGDVNLFRTSNTYTSLMAVLQQFNTNFKHLVNITGRGDVILTWDTIK